MFNEDFAQFVDIDNRRSRPSETLGPVERDAEPAGPDDDEALDDAA
jgi:hypothetical protein